MKQKIVLWGTDEQDKKILIALELLAKENMVKLHTFEEEKATEAFYQQMMDEWRVDKEVEFPEGTKTIDRPLSMTEDLLPETIKVQRTDLISRAKTEWHFIVLSSKLYDLYKSELEELKEKINNLSEFDDRLWNEMKNFWSKVQKQAFERNLFKEHTDKLKEHTNQLFDTLKELKTKANQELKQRSKATYEKYSSKIDDINDRITKGLGLNPIFDELKKLQNDFKGEEFTREDRSKLWNRIDAAFKAVKEKKYGKPSDAQSGGMSRLQRRYDGLMAAIDKMNRSIARDQKDIAFQNKRANETDGQLEMQIRQAKVRMVEERIRSKNEKLKEMMATKSDLEKRLEKEKKKEAKKEEEKKIEEVKEQIKDKIAGEIKDKSEELDKVEDKLKEAADAINETPPKGKKKDNILGAISTTVGEALEDVVDTVKAVSEVVGDKVEETIDEVKEQLEVEEKVDQVKAKVEELSDKIELDEKIEKVKEAVDEVKDKIEEQIDDLKDKVSKKAEEVKSDNSEEE